MLTETFNLRMAAASTLTGSVDGSLGVGGTVRATFAGSVLTGTR